MRPIIFRDSLFDDLFDDILGFHPAAPERHPFQDGPKTPFGPESARLMRTDVKDKEDHYDVSIDLPGFTKEELSLELNEGYLVISASKNLSKEEKDPDTDKYLRRERYSGSMSRSFFVGENMTQDDIHAKFENGVLKLDIPKLEEKPHEEEKNFISIE